MKLRVCKLATGGWHFGYVVRLLDTRCQNVNYCPLSHKIVAQVSTKVRHDNKYHKI